MKYVKTFESFLNENLNEGKDWNDFSAKEIADLFMKDCDNVCTGEDLDEWLNIFAQDKKIEDGLDSSLAEEIVDILKSKGYKKMSMDGVNVYENAMSEEMKTLENEIATLESAADLLEDADAAKAAQKAQLKKMAAAKKAEMEKAKEARRDAMLAKRRAANDAAAAKKPAYGGGRFGDNRFR